MCQNNVAAPSEMRVWKEDDWPCLEQALKLWVDNDDNGPPGGRGMLWTLQVLPIILNVEAFAVDVMCRYTNPLPISCFQHFVVQVSGCFKGLAKALNACRHSMPWPEKVKNCVLQPMEDLNFHC